ncbi:uncharacterized protein LOC126664301 [Mercurialis annua]|uniref:uncharacterized protein LOC126664301 n=1 Tax=Mercurialis annua TaxID=3986 RepID=UPI00215F4BFD|nr:uncharacterized protein LOC126664301 [Mercurialis annua]
MKLMCWNCQGLGSALTVKNLKMLCRSNSPDVVFLMETKNSISKIKKVFAYCEFSNVMAIDPIGKSGGLCLVWKDELDLQIQHTSNNFIICTISITNGPSFDSIFCHLYCNIIHRRAQFQYLQSIRDRMLGPVLCAGDLNDYLLPSEKKGGNAFKLENHVDFTTFMECMEFRDLGFAGPPFTWSNRRNYPNSIKVRLDRALANEEWQALFPGAEVHHLSDLGSDHRPILIKTDPQRLNYSRKFFFDKRWGAKPAVLKIIEESWNQNVRGSTMFQIHSKLKNTRQKLFAWQKSSSSNSERRMHQLQSSIEEEKNKKAEDQDWNRIRNLETALLEATIEEEQFWAQKARHNWLKWGDKNTKYFHEKTKQRRKRNSISGLWSKAGTWETEKGPMKKVICDYFKEIFTSSEPTSVNEFLRGFSPQVTRVMNEKLTRNISEEEIRNAVFSINPTKAPGADGYTAFFYQQYWQIIGPLITHSIQEFFRGGKMLKSLNHTLIALIPKTQNPQSVTDLRPISLCSVYYKIYP